MMAHGAILALSKIPTVKNWQLLSSTLLPGAHVAAIALTGTPYHRMTVNLEDAGFEIRDQLFWVCETTIPIALARKPLSESTVAGNVLEYGTGAINVDGCRIATNDSLGGGAQLSKQSTKPEGWDRPWRHDDEAQLRHAERINANVVKAESLGRFPANVIFTLETRETLDKQSGISKSTGGQNGNKNGIGLSGIYGQFEGQIKAGDPGFGDIGGASRFFKCCDTQPELFAYLKLLITPPDGIILEG